MTTRSKLQLDNIHCSYQGKTILDGLSLQLEQDQILCLLGPSGCGKTTALKAMAGLMPVQSGNMYIDGKQVNGDGVCVPPESRHIGMIFQDYALFPHLTVAANIGFAIRNLPKPELKAKVDELLDLVKLNALGDRYPHQLSGGQQQRVAIARALAYSPQLLLLDEPFSNIDTQVRYGLIEEIRDILKARKMAAVFVTHSKEEGFAFADQMAVMDEGKITQQDSPEQLFNHPKNDFVAEFLGKGVYLPATVVSATSVQSRLGLIHSTNEIRCVPDTKGKLFVRPQYFQLNPQGQVNAKVTHKTFVGSGFNYQLDFEQQIIDVFSPINVAVDAQVELSVVPHQLHLL